MSSKAECDSPHKPSPPYRDCEDRKKNLKPLYREVGTTHCVHVVKINLLISSCFRLEVGFRIWSEVTAVVRPASSRKTGRLGIFLFLDDCSLILESWVDPWVVSLAKGLLSICAYSRPLCCCATKGLAGETVGPLDTGSGSELVRYIIFSPCWKFKASVS